MSLFRGFDDSDASRADPVRGSAPTHEERRTTRTGRLGTGTLACRRCDAPVALTAGPVSPADPLGCPFCGHSASVRDFLSLAPPSRPTRVEVRIVEPGRHAVR